jgi:hypothetical protein
MKKKKNNSKLVVIGIFGMIVLVAVLMAFGVIDFSTMGQKKITSTSAFVDELTDGYFYVWHNAYTNDITSDLENGAYADVFKLCPVGDTNWSKDDFIDHTIWFTSSSDDSIPTLYEGDKLLYISQSSVPEEIEWERFADYGYSIGVSNMESDTSGHCYISNPEGKGFTSYVYKLSDANQVNSFSTISRLYLDKVGNTSVTADNITDGGTVKNLTKDNEYVCEFYTGTYYQDFALTANVHTFGTLETFTTYNYKFLHSNCIEITIPSWFKSGYYYINGKGFFRYVTSLDETIYDKTAYDTSINWNDPVKQYDSNGNLIYDPSTGTDKRSTLTEAATTSAASSAKVQSVTKSTTSGTGTSSRNTSGINADVGLNSYETISGEVKVK